MDDSWEEASRWYDKIVGETGHYYHTHLILPALSKLLKKEESVLDVGCGQGVLARSLSPETEYYGLDISPSLIAAAKKKSPGKHFQVADACSSWTLKKKDFSAAVMLLCFQNMKDPSLALKQISCHLKPGGRLIIVLNHPCFRIPRQSSWGVDQAAKLQYRKVNRYMSPLKIPIQTHPGEKRGETWSFHYSLSDISSMLSKSGFLIENIEEWCSDKKSQGAHKGQEDRARKEFPLFMTLICIKSQ